MTTYREQDKVAELECENEKLREILLKVREEIAASKRKAKEIKDYDDEEGSPRVFTYLLVAIVIGAVIYYIATREDAKDHGTPTPAPSAQVDEKR